MIYTLFLIISFFFIFSTAFGENLREKSVSIGKYTAGCVKNPGVLPFDGYGYQVIRASRSRNYAHDDLILFINEFTTAVKSDYNARLLIADLTKRNGGPMFDDHSSHQTGLDADILYIYKGSRNNKRYSIGEREKMSPQSVLNSSQTAIDPNKWDHINGDILKLAASDSSVDRIFVNPSIKKELCSRYKGEVWLRKVRPWWGHDGHFHVRMGCPESSIKCVPSPVLPEGTGCGSELGWWFSKAAYEKRIKKLTKPKTKTKPVLPVECEGLL